MSLAFGRDLVATPGPSVIPDRVLRAMHRAAPNIYGKPLIEMTNTVLRDLKRVARTDGDPVIYIGNGHATWEASLVNLLSAGDRVLVICNGRFGEGWAATATRFGVHAEHLDFGFQAPADPKTLQKRLEDDTAHDIKAILATHTDTSSAIRNDIPALRAAIDAARHPALFMVDCIASLGVEPFEMDAWGVDVTLAASQKGLMVPPGVAFTFVGPKARARSIACTSPYWDWGPRIEPDLYYQRFCGTAPTHHLYGLREALDMLVLEEGLDAAWDRQTRLAHAIWAAVDVWAEGGAISFNIANPEHRSTAVTTIRCDPKVSRQLQHLCERETGLTLGIGFPSSAAPADGFFRIGHMGHLDPPMVLGTLGTIEAALIALDIPHGSGGPSAAARVIADGIKR